MWKSRDARLGSACCCVPLGLAVSLYAALVLIFSLCAFVVIATEEARPLVGGYALAVRTASTLLGGLGAVCSLGAFVGLHDNTSYWVRRFAHFALLRILARGIILGLDWQALRGCERLSMSGDKFTSMSGRYNLALEEVALSNMCSQVRVLYMVATLADLVVSMYGVHVAYRWCEAVDSPLAYPIALEESRPLRVYTGYADLGYPAAPPGLGVAGAPPASPRSSTHRI
mmetsp:Transcript_99988/g.214202  ORF Transcript_99988/g.214202 Transcript_99988/m.214202 type:complete len:228 (-) Transcript_99988:18-701(-)